MKVQIRTTMAIPEIPPEVEMGSGTLRDLFHKALCNTRLVKEMVNQRTKELNFEEFLEVRLNDVPYYALPKGLDTSLTDGDTVTLSLILLGGG
jgi:hypothetical protein